jgi:hypothetical protein
MPVASRDATTTAPRSLEATKDENEVERVMPGSGAKIDPVLKARECEW